MAQLERKGEAEKEHDKDTQAIQMKEMQLRAKLPLPKRTGENTGSPKSHVMVFHITYNLFLSTGDAGVGTESGTFCIPSRCSTTDQWPFLFLTVHIRK